MRARPSSRPARIFLRFAVVCAAGVLVLAGGGLHADIQQPPGATSKGERQLQRRGAMPPSPVSAQAQVKMGERVEIVLKAYGAPGRTMDFLLRSDPTHGSFGGEPRRLTRDSVAVTYIHRAADGPGHDEFTFAVRTNGGAVSAPATVSIEIPDDPPDVAATPAELDFGTVDTGQVTRAEVTLANHGGSVAEGRLDPPPPWTVEGNAEYHLARGATQTFRLVFRPESGRVFTDALHFAGDVAGSGVRLLGTGLAPATPPGTEPGRTTPTIAGTNPSGGTVAGGSPGPAGGGSRVPTVSPTGTPAGGAPSRVSASPSPAQVIADEGGRAGGPNSAPGPADAGFVAVNKARVDKVEVRSVGASTLELAWKQPTPLPRSYRVELRYLTYDESAPNNLRIDWRPYAQIEIRTRAEQVTASLRGLPGASRLTLRVVSVDNSGDLSQPSPMVTVTTAEPATWWHPTMLKGLFALLAVCLYMLARRRWLEQQVVREIDARRAARERELQSHR